MCQPLIFNVLYFVDNAGVPGGDDGLPAAALERLTEGDAGETVQQTGGGPALLPQGAG